MIVFGFCRHETANANEENDAMLVLDIAAVPVLMRLEVGAVIMMTPIGNIFGSSKSEIN